MFVCPNAKTEYVLLSSGNSSSERSVKLKTQMEGCFKIFHHCKKKQLKNNNKQKQKKLNEQTKAYGYLFHTCSFSFTWTRETTLIIRRSTHSYPVELALQRVDPHISLPWLNQLQSWADQQKMARLAVSK